MLIYSSNILLVPNSMRSFNVGHFRALAFSSVDRVPLNYRSPGARKGRIWWYKSCYQVRYSSSRLVHTIDAFARPFIIDLESTNTTHVNDEVIPTTRFYELKAGDGALFILFLPLSS